METGSRISRYEIRGKIGSGGMGDVYVAADTELGRQVALKILPTDVAGDEDRVRRFVQEAKAASALNHPNILTIYEIGKFEDCHFMAAELITGKTLRERIQTEPMTLLAVLDAAIQTSAALNAAHEAGIIHRDIKPENIMLRQDGLVKVLDFGLAKLTEKTSEEASSEDATIAMVNTKPGMVMGTVAYMSPEQARGKHVDARCDIWSLGVVMFELFTGRRPFVGEEPMDVISSIMKDPAPQIRQISPDLPRQLERIIDKTLRKDVDHRYQHIKDLHIDLEDLREEMKFEARLGQTTAAAIAAPQLNTDARNIHSTFQTAATMVTSRRFNVFHLLLFSLAVAGIAGTFLWYRSSSGGSSVPPRSHKIVDVESWTAAAGELFSSAAFSPDAKLIAFSSTKSNYKNIWVKQTGSTDSVQVTNDTFSDRDPIWSPKGDEIAFFSERGNSPDAGGTGIWRVSALGGKPRSVGALNDGSCELRRWTESGKIYYQSQGDLYAMDVMSGSSVKVTSFADRNTAVTWVDISPDEKQIAYATRSEGTWEIFTSDLDDNDPVAAAEGSGDGPSVVWLPVKRRIFYSSAVDGVFQIFVRDLDAVGPERVTAAATDNIVVDAAPDGRSILFSSVKEESNIWSVNVQDQKESPIARSVNSELWPAVSPNNDTIAFQSVKNLSRGMNLFSGSIMVKPMKGGDGGDRSTQLVENGFLPSWSPDGNALAFFRISDGVLELFTANPKGGGERRVATGGIPPVGYSISPYNSVVTNAFAWSPDGASIAYVSDRGGAANIWTVSPSDGADTAITDNSDPGLSLYGPNWSSDGKRLAFVSQSKKPNANGKTVRGLWIFDAAEKRTTKVFESEKQIRLIGWTADEGGLVIAESDRPGASLPPETMLRRISVASGTETSIAGLENTYYYNIFLSADRKQIAFVARNENMDDIWVVASNGGQPRRLTANNDSGAYFSRLSWLNDGNAIVFGKQTRFSLLSMINDLK